MDTKRLFSKGQRLYKRQKLCSHKAIDQLFGASRVTKKDTASDVVTHLVYPLRAVCTAGQRSGGADIQFFISIPKKRLRHAVDRVTMRRRVREAFRLENTEDPTRRRVDVGFIYVADKIIDTARIRRSMRRLLDFINNYQNAADDNI